MTTIAERGHDLLADIERDALDKSKSVASGKRRRAWLCDNGSWHEVPEPDYPCTGYPAAKVHYPGTEPEQDESGLTRSQDRPAREFRGYPGREGITGHFQVRGKVVSVFELALHPQWH